MAVFQFLWKTVQGDVAGKPCCAVDIPAWYMYHEILKTTTKYHRPITRTGFDQRLEGSIRAEIPPALTEYTGQHHLLSSELKANCSD